MAKFVKGDVVLFTADSHIILYRVGSIKLEKLAEIVEKVVEIIKG